MKIDELKSIIKESIREVLRENNVIKELVAESINTSIATVFKVISENKDLFATKEIIKETVHAAPISESQKVSTSSSDDDAIRKFRAQMKGQAAGIQRGAFGNVNAPSPQQIVNEQTRVQKPAEVKQKVAPIGNNKSNYLGMISSAELDDEDWADQDLSLV